MAQPQKNAFNLTSATLMIAPFGTDPFSLTPAANSVGMVKDVNIQQDQAILELRNGVQQSLVDLKKGETKVQVTANVYEYTAQNILNALGINQTPVAALMGKLTTAITSGVGGSPAIIGVGTGTGVPGDSSTTITVASQVPPNSLLLFQRTGAGNNDYVWPTMSSGTAPTLTGSSLSIPIGATGYTLPAGMSFAVGDNVWVVNAPPVGGTNDFDLFGVKIVGTASNYERPIVVVFPKVKIVKGFSLNFNEKDYGSMPFELMPLLLTASEATGSTRLTNDIGTTKMGVAYVGA